MKTLPLPLSQIKAIISALRPLGKSLSFGLLSLAFATHGVGQSAPPIRLALQYWQAGDHPNYDNGGHYVDVWVEAGWVDDWDWDDNGEWNPTGSSHWQDGRWEAQWVEDYLPDGQYGSRWTTTCGTFGNPVSDSSGAYSPANANRGYLPSTYPIGWNFYLCAWGYAPGGNCTSFQATLYNPRGAVVASGTFSSGSSWYNSATYLSTNGVYRLDISYSNATNTIPVSGIVSYYIAVGVPVPLPPTITAQPSPVSQTVSAGANVSYTVGASNAISYQWQKDGVAIAGATAPTLALSNVQSANSGTYTVVVSGSSGYVTSGGAVLTVNLVAPAINSALTASGAYGTPLSYNITAANLPTSYNASGLPGGLTVNTTTGLISGTPTQTGNFLVTIGATNAAGTRTATLALTISLANQTITFGALPNKTYADPSFTISAAASSGLPVSFSVVSGPATLAANTVTLTGGGAVTLRASQVGNANYNAAPNIDQSFTIAKAGQTIAFGTLPNKTYGDPPFTTSAAASSVLPVSFSVVSGPATLAGNTVTLTGGGTVTLRALQAGNANYNAAPNIDQSFTVSLPPVAPTITVQPAGQTVTAGQSASLAVVATGNPTPTYQWQKGGASLSGATSATLTLPNVQAANAGSYTVVVTNSVSSVTSNAATLTVNAPPAISTQPTSQTVNLGASAAFTVVATGTAPLSYQWQKGGVNLSGATNATLTLTNAQATDVGSYVVVVTNAAGSVNSSMVTLTVNGATVPGVYAFTTLAGLAGSYGSADGTGTAARFGYSVIGIAADAAGNLYAADYSNSTIRKITQSGIVTTLAGSAGNSAYVDGTGASARFSSPFGIVVDSQGNLFVTDPPNRIRKVTPSGVVTTFAGPGPGNYTDGVGAAASFGGVGGIAIDYADNLYVCDTAYNTIRKITPAGVVSTFAGPGAAATTGSTDGPAAAARFNIPRGICADSLGNVYVTDAYNQTIRKITPAGIVTTLAGLPGVSGSVDGTGMAARFYLPLSITSDAGGNLIVADTYNQTLRSVSPAGVVTTIGGLAGDLGNADGVGSKARFRYPFGIAAAPDGSLIIADTYNYTIRRGGLVSQTQTPVVTSGLTARGVIGVPFNYVITATGSPNSFVASGLPSGLSVNPGTGLISGTPTTAGTTNVSIVATNAYGAGSVILTIAIGGPTPVITSPTTAVATIGSPFTYQITASNSPTRFDYGNLPASYFSSTSYSSDTGLLSGMPSTPGTTSMTVYASNNGGTGSAVVTVVFQQAPPSITTQPASQTVAAGASVTFTVAATGTAPLTYQWQKGGVNIAGATNPSLLLANVQSANAGTYTVIVTNGAGSVAGTALLTVANTSPNPGDAGSPPLIINQPVSQNVTVGANVTFTVAATGAAPRSYQWKKNGRSISSGNGTELALTHVQSSDAGSYTVTVSNGAGSVTSNPATLAAGPFATLDWDDNIKGVHQVQMGNPYSSDPNSDYAMLVAKAQAHGTKHAALGIWVEGLLPQNVAEGDEMWYQDDRFSASRYCFSASAVSSLDNIVRDFTSRGIKITAVLILGKGRQTLADGTTIERPALSALYYDKALADAPLYAFNMSSDKGKEIFRTLISFLVSRYSTEDDPNDHKLISGYVIGNEIQGHGTWYNMGDPNSLTVEHVAHEYGKAISIAWDVVNSYNPKVRVYISMNKDWAATPNGSSFSGVAFLNAFNSSTNTDDNDRPLRNIGWHVAFHPYPDGVAPWDDTVTPSFSSPVVTMKNIEVLYFFLNQVDFRYNGQVRRVVLSEQGVKDGGDMDRQAAAYAYYQIRAARTPNVDAMHWMSHRDVDYNDGNGLCTWGLLNTDSTEKPAYSVFDAAENPDWQITFDKYRKKIWSSDKWDWNDLNPYVARPVAGVSSMTSLSHRGLVRPGQTMVGGFAISGSGSKRVLIRGVGPTLANPPYYVSSALRKTHITVYQNGIQIAANEDWQTNSNSQDISQAESQVGAFALGEHDSAVLLDLEPGAYTVSMDSADSNDSNGGIALFEVYSVADFNGNSKLTSLSCRGQVEPNGGEGIGSFAISGSGTKELLIRAVGPGLGSYGVTDYLPHLKISIKSATTGTTLATNINWGDAMNKYDTDDATNPQKTGAFPLAPGSADAALFVRLYPGAYSVIVESSDGSSGNVLFEVYEVRSAN